MRESNSSGGFSGAVMTLLVLGVVIFLVSSPNKGSAPAPTKTNLLLHIFRW